MQVDRENPVVLLIGIPSRGEFQQDMALTLTYMIYDLASKPVVTIGGKLRQVVWAIRAVNTSFLPNSRQRIVDDVLKHGATHLLFIDDDMVFQHTLARDWLEADRDVIAANCPTRSIPCHPTARKVGPTKAGIPIYSDVANQRFEQVWRVGTGIMMVKRHVLEALPRPCFTPEWQSELEHYSGEDWAFVENIEKAGFKVHVDHEHSLAVKHVGKVEYTHEMAVGTRMAVAKQESRLVLPG